MKRDVYPFQRVLRKMSRRKVAYVLIGMEGVNQWMPHGMTLTTSDTDLCIRQDRKTIRVILRILASEHYTLAAVLPGAESRLIDLAPRRLAGEIDWILDKSPLLVAGHEEFPAHTFEFCWSVTGYTFEQLASDACIQSPKSGPPIVVATLPKLLRSKRLAGRDKDMAFLERFGGMLHELSKSSRRGRKRA